MKTITNIGEEILSLRESLKMSKNKLSKLSGITRRTIAKVENGENISVVIIEKLLSAMNCTLYIDIQENIILENQ